MENTNWLSIVIAMLIPMIMGFAYYHPKVVGSAWMKSLGFTEKDLEGGNMPLIFGISLVMSFLLSFFLLNFNTAPGKTKIMINEFTIDRTSHKRGKHASFVQKVSGGAKGGNVGHIIHGLGSTGCATKSSFQILSPSFHSARL